MIALLHGTDAKAAEQIAKNGLLPRQGSGNWSKAYQCQSDRRFVYLTSSELAAHFYGLVACVNNDVDEFAAIIVGVDGDNLFPDENYIIRTVHKITDVDLNVEQNFAGQQEIDKHKDCWEASLSTTKLCTHMGQIPAEHIHTIDITPLDDNIYRFLINEHLDFETSFHLFRHFQLRYSVVHSLTGDVFIGADLLRTCRITSSEIAIEGFSLRYELTC